MSAKRRKPLFERLKKGLGEGIAHAQGELTLRIVEVPEVPPSAADSFRRGWKEAQSGDTMPVDRLLEGLMSSDPDSPLEIVPGVRWLGTALHHLK